MRFVRFCVGLGCVVPLLLARACVSVGGEGELESGSGGGLEGGAGAGVGARGSVERSRTPPPTLWQSLPVSVVFAAWHCESSVMFSLQHICLQKGRNTEKACTRTQRHNLVKCTIIPNLKEDFPVVTR